jgi:hypothetical protein
VARALVPRDDMPVVLFVCLSHLLRSLPQARLPESRSVFTRPNQE